jgi:ATP-binding cassette subfamily A (ABC1) protein 3
MYASVISLRFESASSFEKIMLSFINNLGMSLGVQLIGIFEGLGYGINFSNFTKGISLSDTFSMANVLVILFMNNFLHIFFIYYFDNVFPGDHGVAKPWHFVVSQFYKPKTTNKRNENQSQNIELNGKDFFENESVYSARKIGIRIIDLFKEFKQKSETKTAVENLNLNIYEGQITVLLGHNGAGKSTTISMITGICEPTSGTVLINDKDIVTNTKEARSVLGYCPQHNLLFQDLTVYEHLKFFSKLKKNLDENEINKMLELTNLADKRNALAKTLSGGMKRKLSVAIAFIGGSKTVILDEPS